MNWRHQKATEDKKRRRDLARTSMYIQLMEDQACTIHIMLGSRFIYIYRKPVCTRTHLIMYPHALSINNRAKKTSYIQLGLIFANSGAVLQNFSEAGALLVGELLREDDLKLHSQISPRT